MQIEIPYENITVIDFVGLEWFNQLYDKMYCDGDKKCVVIVSPTEELKKILHKYV